MQWVLLYLSIGHDIGSTSHSAAEMCRSTTMHVPHSFSYNFQIKCFRTHVDTDIISCFGTWNSCPTSVRTFQLHPVYPVEKEELTKLLHRWHRSIIHYRNIWKNEDVHNTSKGMSYLDHRTSYTVSCVNCGLVVRVSGYRSRGPGSDSRRFQIF
jgi:hypothetical protein